MDAFQTADFFCIILLAYSNKMVEDKCKVTVATYVLAKYSVYLYLSSFVVKFKNSHHKG